MPDAHDVRPAFMRIYRRKKGVQDKKERDFRPHYCTAPSRVFSSKSETASSEINLKLSTDDGKIIAPAYLLKQGENLTKSRLQFVHNCSIRQKEGGKVPDYGKIKKKEKLLYKFVCTWYHILCFRPRLADGKTGRVPTASISPSRSPARGYEKQTNSLLRKVKLS